MTEEQTSEMFTTETTNFFTTDTITKGQAGTTDTGTIGPARTGAITLGPSKPDVTTWETTITTGNQVVVNNLPVVIVSSCLAGIFFIISVIGAICLYRRRRSSYTVKSKSFTDYRK